VENKGNSGTEKYSQQLSNAFRFSTDAWHDDLIKQYFSKKSRKFLLENLFLNKQNKILTYHSDPTKSVSLPFARHNFKALLALLRRSGPIRFRNKRSTRLTYLEKNLKNINRICKKNDGLTEDLQHVSKLLERKKELEYLVGQFYSIGDLARALLNSKIFRGYQSCQILIHHKGSSVGEIFTYDHMSGNYDSSISVADFNHLFSTIKKSKNKLFNRSKFSHLANSLGTFLGKEIDLKNHHVIFIISRNDFLPPNDREQDYFNHVASLLTPIFEDFLLRQRRSNKGDHSKICLTHFPLPLAITDRDSNVIFSNQQEFLFDPIADDKVERKRINLENDQIMYISPRDSEKIVSDIYHFQRISLLGELLNTLRHELCNPLFGLKLSADLLFSDSVSREYGEIFQEISKNALRCQDIIQNFSHLYDDKKKKDIVDLKKLTQEIILLTKSETRQIRKEVIFIPDSLETEPVLELNPTWLTQILFNLIINGAQAIKSVTDNFQTHRIVLTINLQSEKNLEISVSDTGSGIEDKNMPYIFLPFFTTKTHGTGLGLSICKNLVQKMGGEIFFKNNFPASGTTFYIHLPKKIPQ
jgi:two-component system, NtrC family, sensor kinase